MKPWGWVLDGISVLIRRATSLLIHPLCSPKRGPVSSQQDRGHVQGKRSLKMELSLLAPDPRLFSLQKWESSSYSFGFTIYNIWLQHLKLWLVFCWVMFCFMHLFWFICPIEGRIISSVYYWGVLMHLSSYNWIIASRTHYLESKTSLVCKHQSSLRFHLLKNTVHSQYCLWVI